MDNLVQVWCLDNGCLTDIRGNVRELGGGKVNRGKIVELVSKAPPNILSGLGEYRLEDYSSIKYFER